MSRKSNCFVGILKEKERRALDLSVVDEDGQLYTSMHLRTIGSQLRCGRKHRGSPHGCVVEGRGLHSRKHVLLW